MGDAPGPLQKKLAGVLQDLLNKAIYDLAYKGLGLPSFPHIAVLPIRSLNYHYPINELSQPATVVTTRNPINECSLPDQ